MMLVSACTVEYLWM